MTNKRVVNKKVSQKKTKPFYRRKGFLWSVGSIVGVILIILLAFRVSPWPGALIIRKVFSDDNVKVKQALEKHTPAGVTKLSDQQYAPGPDTRLDMYYPEGTNAPLPTLIWTHGGAWISGDKDNAEPYYRLIASKGYIVVSLDYTLAPAKSYPAQIHQLNDAHKYILDNAKKFHIDANRIMLAGDSAGSQLSAQMAALITNEDYAREVGINPALAPSQLKGLVLNCGIYKMEGLVHPDPTLPKIVGWGDDVAVWAYSDTSDFSDPVIRQMSPFYHVTKEFPPVYITGGNADPLTDAQSRPFAGELESLGVPVTKLFYPTNHQPALPHEYQFNLDNQDGQKALQATIEFMKARSN